MGSSYNGEGGFYSSSNFPSGTSLASSQGFMRARAGAGGGGKYRKGGKKRLTRLPPQLKERIMKLQGKIEGTPGRVVHAKILKGIDYLVYLNFVMLVFCIVMLAGTQWVVLQKHVIHLTIGCFDMCVTLGGYEGCEKMDGSSCEVNFTDLTCDWVKDQCMTLTILKAFSFICLFVCLFSLVLNYYVAKGSGNRVMRIAGYVVVMVTGGLCLVTIIIATMLGTQITSSLEGSQINGIGYNVIMAIVNVLLSVLCGYLGWASPLRRKGYLQNFKEKEEKRAAKRLKRKERRRMQKLLNGEDYNSEEDDGEPSEGESDSDDSNYDDLKGSGDSDDEEVHIGEVNVNTRGGGGGNMMVGRRKSRVGELLSLVGLDDYHELEEASSSEDNEGYYEEGDYNGVYGDSSEEEQEYRHHRESIQMKALPGGGGGGGGGHPQEDLSSDDYDEPSTSRPRTGSGFMRL
eukprot:Nk52_evm11s269 gene=Nk52_evmTU11s269